MNEGTDLKARIAALEGKLHTLGENLAGCRAREERFQNLFDAMFEGFGLGEVILNAQGHPCDFRLLEINTAFARLTGFPASQARGSTVRTLVPEIEPRLLDDLGKVALTGQPLHQEYHFQRGNRWLDLFAYRPAPGQVASLLVDISERKHMEQALGENEARLQLARRAAGVGFFDWHIDINHSVWSPELETIFGLEPGTGSSEMWPAILHPDDLGHVNTELQRCFRERCAEIRGSYRIIRPGGEVRWVSGRASISYASEGTPLRMTGALIDITQEKRAEKALRQSEELYRHEAAELQAIYETAPIGMCLLDTQLRFVRVNERLAESNGVPVQAHLGKTVRQVIPAIADKAEPGLRRVLQTGQPVLGLEQSSETPAQPGVLRTWVSNWWPIKDDAGQVIGISVMAEEITERKRMEAVRHREQEFRTLAENSTDGISRFDRGLRRVYANPAIARYLQYLRESMIGATNSELGLTDALGTAYDQRLRQIFETGREQIAELRVETPQGARILESRLIPEFAEDGKVETVLAVSRDITQRKRAEQAARESERKYRELIDNLQEGIWLIDEHGTTTLVNQRMAEMFGYRPEEMVGVSLFHFMDQRAADHAREDLARRQHDARADYEFEFRRKDGSPILTRIATTPLFDPAGHYDGTLAAVEDITAQKRAEQALQESERRYRQLVETLNEGIWASDHDSRTTYVNRRMAEMLGYDVEEMLGKTLFDFMDEHGVKLAQQDVQRRRADISEEHDFELLRKDGTRIYVRMMSSPLLDDHGNYQGSLAGMVDITDRRKAEAALRESEARFREVVELVPDILYRVPLPGYRAEFFSPEVERLLGISREEWQGDPQIWVRQLHEDDRERVLEEWESALRGGNGFVQHYRIWHKDGQTLRWVEDRHWIERDEQGNAMALFGAINDITDRKQAEEALRIREQEFRALAERSPDVVARLDSDLCYRYINPVVERYTGHPPSFFIGKNVWQVDFPSESAALISARARHVFEHGEESVLEFAYPSPAGKTQHFESRLVPEFGADGIAHSVITVSRDITRLREAEEQVHLKMRQLAQSNEKLAALSRQDALTHLANRRYLFEYLEKEWRREARHDKPVSVIIADIDYFKAFNDHYGHLAGDDCLVKIANTLQQQIHRPSDLLARYGGEEFVVVLPETPIEGAERLAETMRQAINDLRLEHAGSSISPYVTISLGVASLCPKQNSIEKLFSNADQAMYQAKSAGRNRVRLYGANSG